MDEIKSIMTLLNVIFKNLKKAVQAVFDRKWCSIIVLTILTLLCFLPSFFSSFVYDDHALILENPLVTGKEIAWWETFSHPFPWKGNSFEYYRPVTILSYRFNTLGENPSPFLFHTVNILLHLTVVLLCFFWVRLLLKNNNTAFFSALLFALMPGHAETVFWISGRSDLIISVFFMAVLLSIHKLNKKLNIKYLTLIVVFFTFGILTKESMVVLLPLIVALYLGYERNGIKSRKGWQRSCLTILPLLFVFIGYIILRIVVVGSFFRTVDESGTATILQRIPLAGKVFLQAFLNLIYLPRPNIEYHWSQALNFNLYSIVGWFIVIIAITAWFKIKNVYIRHGIVITICGFLTYTHLLYSTELFAERYLYLPSIGFCLLLGAGYHWLRKRTNSSLITILAICWGLTIGIKTFNYGKVWKNDLTLWSYTVKISPKSPKALTNYGISLMNNSDSYEALKIFKKLQKLPGEDLKARILQLKALGRLKYNQAGVNLAYASLVKYPDSSELLFLLGRHEFKLGDKIAAKKTLENLEKLGKKNHQANKYAQRLRYELNTGRPWIKKTPLLKSTYIY